MTKILEYQNWLRTLCQRFYWKKLLCIRFKCSSYLHTLFEPVKPPASLTEATKRLKSVFFLSSPTVYKTCPSVQIPVIASFCLFIKCKMLQVLRVIFSKCTIQLYPRLHDENMNHFNPSIWSYIKLYYIILECIDRRSIDYHIMPKGTHYTVIHIAW